MLHDSGIDTGAEVMQQATMYECQGGPMDGASVGADELKAGRYSQCIRPKPWLATGACADTGKTMPSMAVWQWCKPGRAHLVVTYALSQMGTFLQYQRTEKV